MWLEIHLHLIKIRLFKHPEASVSLLLQREKQRDEGDKTYGIYSQKKNSQIFSKICREIVIYEQPDRRLYQKEAGESKYSDERPGTYLPVCRNIENQYGSKNDQFNQQDEYVQKPKYSHFLTFSPLNGKRQLDSDFLIRLETGNKLSHIFLL